MSEKFIHRLVSRACKRRRGTVQNHQPPSQSQIDHGPDQQVADENSVRSQSRQEVVQEIAQLSKDQDVKAKDHVRRIQGVLESLAVR